MIFSHYFIEGYLLNGLAYLCHCVLYGLVLVHDTFIAIYGVLSPKLSVVTSDMELFRCVRWLNFLQDSFPVTLYGRSGLAMYIIVFDLWDLFSLA